MLLAVASASATTYDSTERDFVSLEGTCDFLYHFHDGGLAAEWVNVTLPALLVNVDDTSFIEISSTDDDGLIFSIECNGDMIANNSVIAGVDSVLFELDDILDALTDNATQHLSFLFTIDNATNVVEIVIEGTGVEISFQPGTPPGWTQEDVTDPKIDSRWKVMDNISLPNGLGFDIENMNLFFRYPPSNDEGATGVLVNGTTIVDGGVYNESIEYFKIISIDEDDITSGNGEVTIAFKNRNKVERATWEIDYTTQSSRTQKYVDAFAGMNTNTLSIEIDGKTHDERRWEISDGKIIIERIDLPKDDVEIVFTWTTPPTAPPTPPPEEEEVPFLEDEFIKGIPNWTTLAIVAVVIIALLAIFSIEKKKK